MSSPKTPKGGVKSEYAGSEYGKFSPDIEVEWEDGDDYPETINLAKKTTGGGDSHREQETPDNRSGDLINNHRVSPSADIRVPQRHSIVAHPNDAGLKNIVRKIPLLLHNYDDQVKGNAENHSLLEKDINQDDESVDNSASESAEENEVQEVNANEQGNHKILAKFLSLKTFMVGRLAEKKKQAIAHVTKKAASCFLNVNQLRESMLVEEALLIDKLAAEALDAELEMLDKIETTQINIYSAIARQRIRISNQGHEYYKKRFGPEGLDIIQICFALMKKESTALGFEDEKLRFMISVLSLVIRCLEFGLFTLPKIKELLLCLFQKTEFINKQEEYITKSKDFKDDIYEKLIACKSLSSGILLHIVTCINDDWLYHYTKVGEVDDLMKPSTVATSIFKKKSSGPPAPKDHSPFVCDVRSYSFFSFIMFNYLLKELRKDGELFSLEMYLTCMKDLVLYVYDYREDPFVLTYELIKPEYLTYYINLNIEDDHINRANEILKLTSDLKEKFKKKAGNNKKAEDEKFEQLEQDIGNIFGMLEILMGLQDETYSIRLMLTEKKMPELLVEIFVNMQDTYIGESGDELVIQGLKVLYQLCKGNYTGQALITKGKSWFNFKKLIKGSFSVFNILFLKQLFEDDPKFLHINQEFSIELIDLFNQTFVTFFDNFKAGKPINNAKDLVSLYAFKSLINLFIKTGNISHTIRRSYNLPISSKLYNMVVNFAFPLFKKNNLLIDHIYEPKLLTKNWKLEDGSFLVSLMMLSGDHINCMLVDFAYSLIKLFNKSCENYYPSEFVEGMHQSLPLDMACFDYLARFSEGIKFRTEIMNSYCIFRIFYQSSKIPYNYSLSELSLDGADTMVDFLPESHLTELPDMIINELKKFDEIHNARSNFPKEDLLEYLLRGLCQMSYKYATGITWYLQASEKDELKSGLTQRIQVMSRIIQTIMEAVMEEGTRNKDGSQSSRSAFMLQQMTKDQQSGITVKLKESLETILYNVERMWEAAGPTYSILVNKYVLNIGKDDIMKLKTARLLLQCEASFVESLKTKGSKKIVDDEEGDAFSDMKSNSEHVVLKGLMKQYKAIKKTFLSDKKKNKFYEVLQSKMENTNQANLISYVCHSLDTLDHQTCQYNSLWFSKSHINTIVFLNNTMNWCQKTRYKLYEYLGTHKAVQQKLIGTIYKGLRDCFTLLAYGPFFNEQWEIIFSKFIIFASFIKGLCKQNCQEFKIFLGEFIPDLHCKSHATLNYSVLEDLFSVLLKFLNFSGISFNKDSLEYPSDRLSTILLTDQVMRCLIDMLTGPCKLNQKKIFNKGIVIWLNVFGRIIDDLDSKYYVLMNNMLEYLLSLVEGNSSEILKSLATSFDIPVLYNVMTKLMTMLWRRVMKKRKHDNLKKMLMERKKAAKKNPITGVKDGIGGSKSSVRSSEFLMNLEGSKEVAEIDTKKIDNWSDLISMYMNGDFQSIPALSCAIKIFIFLSRVSYKSKKYQIFFDIKEAALTDQFKQANFSQEEIRLNQVTLKGKTHAADDLISYYFMKNITSRVEIKEANLNSEIVIFPKSPICFFLREATMNTFTENCSIENTESKLVDMFESFEQFYFEMQIHQKFKSTYRVIGKFATDKFLKYLRIICYFISVAINFLLLYDIEFEDDKIHQTSSTISVLFLTIILDLLSLISVGLWLMANFNVTWIESYKKFKVKHPFKNPYSPINLFGILTEVFVRKDILNFVLHFSFATLGVSYSILFQVI
jgi:hypothetical protein